MWTVPHLLHTLALHDVSKITELTNQTTNPPISNCCMITYRSQSVRIPGQLEQYTDRHFHSSSSTACESAPTLWSVSFATWLSKQRRPKNTDIFNELTICNKKDSICRLSERIDSDSDRQRARVWMFGAQGTDDSRVKATESDFHSQLISCN